MDIDLPSRGAMKTVYDQRYLAINLSRIGTPKMGLCVYDRPLNEANATAKSCSTCVQINSIVLVRLMSVQVRLYVVAL